jgi:cobalt-zinc-cadmium resistance protein CzcA
LGVPLFNSAQKARVNAGNLAISQNRLEKTAITQQLQSNLKDAITLYLQNKQIVTSYELNILPNSKILIEAATKKIKTGEIGYLEWVMIVNQAIQSKSEYLAYVQQLNEAAFEVEKITLNN